MKRLTLAEASAILIGTQIGAGVLGLPYALREAGFAGIAVIISVGFLTLLTALFVLELAVHRGGTMTSLARDTLGKAGGWLMLASISVLSYGALIAYIAGSGDILSSLTGINGTIAAVIFWLVMSWVVFMGLKASGEAELALNFLLLGALAVAVVLMLPKADPVNMTSVDPSAIVSGIGVAIFAYVSHMVVPEMYKGLGSAEKTKKAVLIGYLVPMGFYALFVLAFVGALGADTPQLATSALENYYGSLGKVLGLVLPLAAISTSYIGIGFAQMDNLREAFNLEKRTAWLLTVLPPLLIYFAGLKSFVSALWLAGTFGGLLYAGILPVAMYLRTRDVHPPKCVRIPHGIAYFAGALFLLVFIYSVASLV
ncbi:aromatic amino acid transport family protein [Thermococcus aciditolerans]|uniref:GerAB/ArcD/ProY family transporter n=1 Tax=Thermococcus aciditolerans TaxID=2598455 RepID=A0A5C0SP12_9EURY|nr:aromatic amino acid transport family protein [Thermococcus aciditolerans]QEK15722.1 GerAB/ArcD/ProY family transporter [Thermococcus aciditolerans]